MDGDAIGQKRKKARGVTLLSRPGLTLMEVSTVPFRSSETLNLEDKDRSGLSNF